MKTSGILIRLFNGFLIAALLFMFGALISPFVGVAFAFISLLMTVDLIPTPSGVLGANYTPSALAKAQAKLIGMFQAGELREIDPVTYKQFRRNSEIMIPSHKQLRTREDRVLEAYYTVRTRRALGTGRSHAPSGTRGDSGILTPSFITWNDTFSISMKQADNNVFAFDEMFSNEITNVMKNFSAGNETNATAALFNNRSAVNNGVAEGVFNATTTTFEINESVVGNRAVQVSGTNMAENLYGGMALTYFCDSVAFNKFQFLAKQGATNATNTSFQFEGKTFVLSLGLTTSAATLGYTKGFWIVVPDGTIAVLDWIPKQNREGVIKPPYNYSSFLNPMDDLNYALFYTYLAQNSTSIGGYTQDILTTYEFSQDLAFEHAPLSTANETTLQAFALI